MVRLFVWNILHGGGSRRIPHIALAILDARPDVVALSEYRRSMGGQLAGVLADHGLKHQLCTDPPGRKNGVLLASRSPIERIEGPDAPAPIRHKWLAATMPELPLSVLLAHLPDDSNPRHKLLCWNHLLDAARPLAGTPTAVLGDLNTGRHKLDESGSTFRCVAQMGKLRTMGFEDAWRALNPDGREYSWFSHEGGGFRIDHALLSPPLRSRLRDARYDQGVREAGLSDHAALLVDLD